VDQRELAERFRRAVHDLRSPLLDPVTFDPAPVHENLATVVVETTQGDEGLHRSVREPEIRGPINVWQHPRAHPIVLDLMLIKQYGLDWLAWEPETLELRVVQDFKTDKLSELNMHKVQAVKTMHLVNTFWRSWEVFLWCTMAVNECHPDFETMQVPGVPQCLISADIAGRVRDDVEWSDELRQYLAVVYRHDGIFYPLPPLEFVTIDVPEVVDVQEIARRWPAVRATSRVPDGETIVDEQLRRLLGAYDELERSRALLRAQLPMVNDV
jgi:hypothetical protein